MKIRSVGAEKFHAVGHHEANGRFTQFHNVYVCQSDPRQADSITIVSS